MVPDSTSRGDLCRIGTSFRIMSGLQVCERPALWVVAPLIRTVSGTKNTTQVQFMEKGRDRTNRVTQHAKTTRKQAALTALVGTIRDPLHSGKNYCIKH